MLRRLLRDTLTYSTASIVAKGVGFLLIPLYTRILTPADYGAIDILNVYLLFSVVLFSCEIVQAVARYLPEMQSEQEKSVCASSALLFVVATFSCFALVNLAFRSRLSALIIRNSDYASLFALSVPWIISSALMQNVQSQLRWDLQSRKYATVSVVVVTTSILSTLLFVVVLRFGARGFILGQTTGSLCGLALSLYFSRARYQLAFSWSRLRSMLAFSLPLVPSSLAVFVWNYVDRVFINVYLSLDDVGLYSVAFRFASITTLILGGFNLSFTPLIYHYYREKDTPSKIALVFSLFLFLMLPILLGSILFAREVFIVMTSERYYGAAVVLPFLVGGSILTGLYNFAPGLSIAKKTGFVLLINVVAAAFSLSLNFFFVPRLGILGAGLTYCIGGASTFGLYVLLSQRHYPVPYRAVDIAVFVLGIALAAVTSLFLHRLLIPYWFSIAVRIMVFAAGCVLPAIRCLSYLRSSSLGAQSAPSPGSVASA